MTRRLWILGVLLMVSVLACDSRGPQSQQSPAAVAEPESSRAAVAEPKKPDTSIDSRKFDDVRRAGQTVKSAVDLGASVARYRELLQSFDTEIALVQVESVTEKERESVALYRQALEAYKDALPIWNLKFERSNEMRKYFIGHDDGLVFPGKREAEIINRYGIPWAPLEGRQHRPVAVGPH